MGNPEVLQEVEVKLPHQRYTIYIGRHLLHDAARLHAVIPGTQALIVTNQTLAPLYLDSLREALRHVQCQVVILPDGEAHKTQASVAKIHQTLIQHKHHRDTVLIALAVGLLVISPGLPRQRITVVWRAFKFLRHCLRKWTRL